MIASHEMKGLTILLANIEALRTHLPQGAAVALREEAEIVITKAKDVVPVNLGTLRASGFVEKAEVKDGAITCRMGFGGAASLYALYVHEGTRPHFPPVSAILPWVVRKFGLSASDPTTKGVAFLVARKISRTGTAPTKYLERPFLERTRGLADRVGRRTVQLALRALKRSA